MVELNLANKKDSDFFIIKPTRCNNFLNFFWHETLRVADSSSVHHQEFFTVHSALVYVIQVCRQLSSRSICICCPQHVESRARKNLRNYCI